jgi:hypothetical protein
MTKASELRKALVATFAVFARELTGWADKYGGSFHAHDDGSLEARGVHPDMPHVMTVRRARRMKDKVGIIMEVEWLLQDQEVAAGEAEGEGSGVTGTGVPLEEKA